MKKILLCLSLLFFCASAYAQSTLVSGTVTDAGGQAWINGTYRFQFIGLFNYNGPYNWTGGVLSTTPITGSLDGTGSFTNVSVPSNTAITPSLTKWQIQVCPIGVSSVAGCFSTTLTVTGASQNITGILTPPVIQINASANNQTVAYTDSEIQGPIEGSTYSNFLSGKIRFFHNGVWGDVGGGGTPGGSPIQTQVNNGGVFGGTPCETFANITTGPINQDCDLHTKGPNPYVDVTRYGVRAPVVTATPVTLGITANINSGSASATVSTTSCPSQVGNVCFINGDGVVIYGAGPAHAMTTPTGVTVTPSLAQAGTGTGLTVPGPAGATTYNYQVIARDKNGGLTAASSVATTVTGAASLGSQTIAISTLTRSGNTTTVTTAVPHGLTASGNNQPMVYIRATSDDINFGGWFSVITTPDNTHFTFISGLDTLDGAPTSATGGSVIYFNVNHITWSIVTGAWEYCVYGRTGGSLTWIGCSRPQQTSGFTSPVDLTFDDFGPTMMANFQLPGLIPNTPPGVATSDSLVTTIISGAGTTSLTLANTASTTVAGNPIRFDNAPNILTAANAARNGFGLLHFPVAPNQGQYVINSYLTLPSSLTVSFSGGLYINDTVEVSIGSLWTGGVLPQGVGATSFAQNNWIVIGVHEANPGIYSSTGRTTSWRMLQLLGQGLLNGGLLLLADENTPVTFEDVNFIESTSSTSYMGIGLILRGDAPGLGNSSFVNMFKNVLFSGGPSQVDGTSATPYFYCNGCGLTRLDSVNMNVRGIFYRPVGAGGSFELNTGRQQGGIMPTVMYFNNSGSSAITSNIIRQFEQDSMPHAIFANMQGGASLLILEGAGTGGTFNGATGATVTGNPIRGIFMNNQGGASGQNRDVFIANQFAGYMDSATGVVRQSTYSVHRAHDRFPGSERIFFDIGAPASPTATVAAGGALAQPVTYTYKIGAVGFDGGVGPMSVASTSCTTSAGNQTCNVSWTAVVGATQYVVYRATGGGYIGIEGGGCNPPQTGTTFSDNGSLGTCNPPPADSASGIVYVNKSEMSAPTQRQVSINGSSTFIGPTLFGALGTPANGTFTYCPDCTIANPCAGAGTGALAKRLNGVWVCN